MAKVGRPRKYPEVEEMQANIDNYFNTCEVNGILPGVAGLAYHLGFSSRDAVSEYAKRPEFSDTIKKARLRVELALEQKLSGQNVTGTIFNLKNNFGWKDKQEHEHTGKDGGPIILWGADKSE